MLDKQKIQTVKLSKNKKQTPDYLTRLGGSKPPVKSLHILGEIIDRDKYAIGVVGSRRITEYGRRCCSYIVKQLASSGLTIVSGLMYGVDIEAHNAALDVGGRTIAVLGYGFGQLTSVKYAKDTVKKIVAGKNGAILSEYSYSQKATKWSFPKRNRIISGLSNAVLIVEAAERLGSLITAEMALDEGKDVFVIPGSIFSPESKGKHQLIKQGAYLVDSAEDILNYMGIEKGVSNKSDFNIQLEDLTDIELEVLENLNHELENAEETRSRTSLSSVDFNVVLSSLEIKGLVRRDIVGNICRKGTI